MSIAIKKGSRIERASMFELGPGLILEQNNDGLPLLQATTIDPAIGGTGLTEVGEAGSVLVSNGNTLLYALLNDGNLAEAAGIGWSKIDRTGAVPDDVGAAPAVHTHTVADLADLATASTGITRVGTVVAGTWQGAPVAPAHGGTGLAAVGAAGTVLASDGTALSYGQVGDAQVSPTAAIAWSKLDKTGATAADVGAAAVAHTHALDGDTVTGVLPLARGGTGLASAGAAGQVLTTSGTAAGWGAVTDAHVDPAAAIAWSKVSKDGATAADVGAAAAAHGHSLEDAEITGILPVGRGGTGVDTSAAAQGQLLIGNGTGLSLGHLMGTNGIQVLPALNGIILSVDGTQFEAIGVRSEGSAEYHADMNAAGSGEHEFYVFAGQRMTVGRYNVRFAVPPVPETDNAVTLGASGRRWSAVWAAQGTIQTSTRESKELLDVIDGAAALELLRGVPVRRFRYRDDTEGMTHVGVVLDELPPELRTTDDGLNYATIASVAMAGVQGLDDEVAALRARVAALERRLAADGADD